MPTRTIKIALAAMVGTVFALAALFFAYYTVRLIYVNVAVSGVATHRQAGMYIGAVAFPVATLVFGSISWLCLKSVRQIAQRP